MKLLAIIFQNSKWNIFKFGISVWDNNKQQRAAFENGLNEEIWGGVLTKVKRYVAGGENGKGEGKEA